jgi:hypothetical protein
MNQWLKDRVIHVLIYGTIILGIGFSLYSVFLKPTNRTVYTAPSTHMHTLEGLKVYPLSCARLDLKDK